MSQKFQDSQQNGAHSLLKSFTGTFKGTARTWFEPGDPVDTSPVSSTLRTVLGGRFLMHEYTGSMQGKPLEGMALIGYFLEQQRWQAAWIDSYHNGTRIMLSESPESADPSKPDMTGHYPAPPGPDWGWRTTLEAPSADHIVITHFNITPDGQEVKAVEFDLQRHTREDPV